MPVFFAGWEPDDITGMEFFDGAAEALGATAAGGDDQGLAEGVGVPGSASSRLEGDGGTGDACWRWGLEKRVDADGAGEPIGRAFAGGD